MENHLKAAEQFKQRIDELKKDAQPALYEDDLKEIVIYEKLLEIQEYLAKLSKQV
jgi:hypothetical protein